MKLSLTVEADAINVLALNMGRISVDITLKRPDLVDQLNDIIAKHYPEMLAAK